MRMTAHGLIANKALDTFATDERALCVDALRVLGAATVGDIIALINIQTQLSGKESSQRMRGGLLRNKLT